MLKTVRRLLVLTLAAQSASVGMHAADRRSEAEAQVFAKGGDQPGVSELWQQSQNLRASARRGRGYYEQDCMKCHGVKGGADGELAAQLPGAMIRFNDAAAMASRSDRDLFYDIAMGRERSAMPAWYPGYTGQQLKDTVAYLRALQNGRAVPPSNARVNHSAFLLAKRDQEVRAHAYGVNHGLNGPKPAWVKRVRPTATPTPATKP